MATPPQSQSAPRGLEVEITIVIGEDGQAVNYYQQITENSGANFFTSPWGGCLLKNCDEIGDLLEFSKISDYERFMRESYKTFISQPNAISLQFCMIYMIYKLSQTRESTLYWELD